MASDIPAFREIAGDSAIYFNLEDKNDLYSKLKDIAEDMEVHKEAKLGIAFKRSQQFSWEKAAEQTLNIYESSLSL